MSSQELILGSLPQETRQPQRSDIMPSTVGKTVYGYMGLQTTGTPKALEIVCLFMVNS